MAKFDHYMLNNDSNLTPTATLRHAQVDMLQEGKRLGQWAAFTTQRDWKD